MAELLLQLIEEAMEGHHSTLVLLPDELSQLTLELFCHEANDL